MMTQTQTHVAVSPDTTFLTEAGRWFQEDQSQLFPRFAQQLAQRVDAGDRRLIDLFDMVAGREPGKIRLRTLIREMLAQTANDAKRGQRRRVLQRLIAETRLAQQSRHVPLSNELLDCC